MTRPADATDTDVGALRSWLRRHGPVKSGAGECAVLGNARGVRLETADGRELLDFASGGEMPLGHNDTMVREALAQAQHSLARTGTEWPARILLMRKLAELVPGGRNRRVLLCDSGREALAQAVVLARASTGRSRVVYLAELPGEAPDFGSEIAAVVAHPFDARLPAALEFCRRTGALLVDDETGIGPGTSGRMFAVEWAEVRPDLYLLGRGLGAGVPIGACVTGSSTQCWHDVPPAAGPAVCSVALGLLELLEQGLLEAARTTAGYLRSQLEGLVGHGPVEAVLGAGLALTLRFEGKQWQNRFVAQSHESGLLLLAVGDRAVGVRPALVVSKDEVDRAVEVMRKVTS